jgi:hypothetical protein
MDYSFIRESFDINSIAKNILSIQVTMDGFSFVISPVENQQSIDYIYIKKIEKNDTENLTDTLSSFRGFDQKEFYAIRIIIHEIFFTLVPEPIFDLRDMKAYLKLNHPHRVKSKNLSNRISVANAVCVFSLEEGLYELLKKKFPGADFCHTSLPFCTMALNKSTESAFFQCYEKSMELAIVKDQKLALYNIFSLQDETDIIYFILNAYKSTGIDPTAHPLFISGLLSKTSETISLIGKYIKDIRFYTPDYIIIPGEGESNIPSYYFLNHREILNCEL